MNGPEHYAESERLLESSQDTSYGNLTDVLTALTHAVLALSVATIEADREWSQTPDLVQWEAAEAIRGVS